VIGILMVSRFVHEPEDIRAANKAAAERMRGNLDWAGIAFMSVGLASMQYVLEEGTRNDWFQSTAITLATAVAVFSLVAFFVQEFRAPHPAVNLRLFRNGIFSSATVIGGIMFAILMGNMFLLPVFMQELLGYTALQSGWALMPRSLVMMVATPIVGKLYNRVPPPLLIGLGVIGVAWGSWEMGHFTLQTTPSDITASLVMQGVGFALLFVPLTTVAMSHIARNDIADASGLNSLMRQLGGSIGLAVFTTMLTRWSVQAGAAIGTHIDVTRPQVRYELTLLKGLFQMRGMDAIHARSAALTMLQRQVSGQAAVIAFDKTFIFGAGLMVLLFPLVFMLRRADNTDEDVSTMLRPSRPERTSHAMPEVPVIDRPAVSARRDPVEPEAPETPARPPAPRVVGTEGEHAPRREAPRRRMLVRIAALLALVAIGFGVYRWFAARGAETTDDAQVEGHLIPILARVQGYVQSVDVNDNQTVRAGEMLVQLDDRDLQAQVAKAQADVREQQTVSASGGQASAQVAVAQANLVQARANASHAEADLARMQTLARDGAISQQQLEVAQTTAATARAAVTAAEDQVAAARAGRQGASGKLQSLEAAETQAALQLSYTKIAAPLGGVVSNRAGRGGPARFARPAADDRGAARRHLDRRELQGDSDAARPRRRSRADQGRRVPRPRVPGSGRERESRDGRQVLAAPPRQRDRQLHQGRAARSGADPPGRRVRSAASAAAGHERARDRAGKSMTDQKERVPNAREARSLTWLRL
jgi:multidrug efflux pump subunit AcrA (membrane-fusion protein)